MSALLDALHSLTDTTGPASAEPRFDLYAFVHKALRHAMTDTLVRLGRLDVFDPRDMNQTLNQLGALLKLCEQHIAHENEFIHAAIEMRRPGLAEGTSADHADHVTTIGSLRRQASALTRTAAEYRSEPALALYRNFARFVAENLEHMHNEETANNAALWAAYTDAELRALEARLIDSIPPHQRIEMLRWLLPALSPAERVEVLTGLRKQMPTEAFLNLLDQLCPHVDQQAWAKLARDLRLPSQRRPSL